MYRRRVVRVVGYGCVLNHNRCVIHKVSRFATKFENFGSSEQFIGKDNLYFETTYQLQSHLLVLSPNSIMCISDDQCIGITNGPMNVYQPKQYARFGLKYPLGKEPISDMWDYHDKFIQEITENELMDNVILHIDHEYPTLNPKKFDYFTKNIAFV